MAESAAGPGKVLAPDRFRNPELTVAAAADLLAAHWGIEATEVEDVGSLQDRNFRVRTAAGEELALKVANAEIPDSALRVEHAAMAHLRGRIDGVEVPRPLPSTAGEELVVVDGHAVRLLTWVPGTPLGALGRLAERDLEELGRLAAASAAALADFDDPAAHRSSQWDTRIAVEVVEAIEPSLDSADRIDLWRALGPLRTVTERFDAELPRQVIHSDVTDVNLVGGVDDEDRFRATGLIDFGDVIHTWRVCDPASSIVAAVGSGPADPLDATLSTLRGYLSGVALEEVELEALWPAVLARAAVCVASSRLQARESPGHDYVSTTLDSDLEALRRVLSVPPALAAAAIREVAGLPPVRDAGDVDGQLRELEPGPLCYGFDPGAVRAVDLSVASPDLGDGAWLDPGAIATAIGAGEGTALGRWGEARLVHAAGPGPLAPDALHLGADLFLGEGTAVLAPLDGEVVEVGERELTIALDRGSLFLRLAGIRPVLAAGTQVVRGAEVGTVAPAAPGAKLPPHLHLQLGLAAGLPGLGDPRRRAAWLALCPDPSALLGIDAAAPAPPDPAAERARREAVLAGAQGLYYREPMEMVRGWRATLIDSDARPYLDLVNNVAAVGHSHPGVTAAATEQLRLLNTNSRFLYDSLTEYAERIVALMPEGVDRVFVVNSGSEALDLAIQLARVYTGRRDLAAIFGAYHGWTEAVYEFCTSPQDNPGWEATKPDFIHVVDQPDPLRGRHGDDAEAYVESVRAACAAAAGRGGLAAFVSEALLGNQGAVAPPAGYLAGAYEVVRAAGGVCIADEVQVGVARTGTDFWAFEHEGVVPDIVATAKAAGNGHPIGIVACRAEIADALGRRASFFSSPGGGPVSCRVGLAVLDAIQSEGLQERAARVGGDLKARLEGLADRHPAIGAVNGRGLYLAVDIVVPGGVEPDPAEAEAICERLRELGLIMQPTGDAYNFLKVKPPMCLDEAEVEYFVAALDQVLGEREMRAAAALPGSAA